MEIIIYFKVKPLKILENKNMVKHLFYGKYF